ncbi:MAG TPA: RNA-binding S4 domain-containing protein, partial [Thiolinea sp.]|nr:RNA-binding S4 domain-containing protein [Thiolinea sp.]
MGRSDSGLAAGVETLTALRLDKWLWAARFFKTRTLAVAAVNGGHVQVNEERAKPSKSVHVGDVLRIRKDQ